MTARLTLVPSATVSPERGPVPCAPGDTPPLFYMKHVGGGRMIFHTTHGTAPDPVADGWHPIALTAAP